MEEARKNKKIKKFRTENGTLKLVKTKYPYQITKEELFEFVGKETSYRITRENLEDFSKEQSEIGIKPTFSFLENLEHLEKGKEEILER